MLDGAGKISARVAQLSSYHNKSENLLARRKGMPRAPSFELLQNVWGKGYLDNIAELEHHRWVPG